MSTIESITTLADGTVFVRFLKSDGGWHRTSIPPGVDTDTQMAAVNAHLKAMGCAECSDLKELKDHVTAAHTKEVVAKFRAAQEKKK